MKKNKYGKQLTVISVAAFALLIASCSIRFNATMLILSILSMAGACVCRIIVLYMLDKNCQRLLMALPSYIFNIKLLPYFGIFQFVCN